MLAPSDPARAEEQAPNLVPPPGNPRFPLFDGLRALAALSVLVGHTVTLDPKLTGQHTLLIWGVLTAYQGVAIFFLISGFLLYRPFLVARRHGAPLGISGYAVRRVLRIVPAYWAALSIFLAAGWVSGITTHNWWIFYGFGQIYSTSTLGQGAAVAWTLCVEVTFYACLPLFVLVAAALSRRPGALRADVLMLCVLSAASLAFRAHFDRFQDAARVSTLAGTFVWFGLGMGVAILSARLQQRAGDHVRGLTRHWPIFSWITAAVLFVLLHEVTVHAVALSHAARAVVTVVLYGVAALFILLPAVFGQQDAGLVRGFLAARPLAWIGLVSYAVYLYHSIVIMRLEKAFASLDSAGGYVAVLVCALALSLLCAAVSYYALERPMMLLGRGSRIRRRSALGWRGRIRS